MITRRQAILIGIGLPAVIADSLADSREFWNEKTPSAWTDAEIQQLLTKSPWAKEASIDDKGQTGPLSSAHPPVARRGGRSSQSGASTSAVPFKWKATVRWESALPIREALQRGTPGETPPDYILNVFGEVPGADTDVKDLTKLEHKGDQIKLNRVEPLPDGTLFHFSRLLALRPEDKEVLFSTKLGPLEIKCKFALKEMLYRGNLEL